MENHQREYECGKAKNEPSPLEVYCWVYYDIPIIGMMAGAKIWMLDDMMDERTWEN